MDVIEELKNFIDQEHGHHSPEYLKSIGDDEDNCQCPIYHYKGNCDKEFIEIAFDEDDGLLENFEETLSKEKKEKLRKALDSLNITYN